MAIGKKNSSLEKQRAVVKYAAMLSLLTPEQQRALKAEYREARRAARPVQKLRMTLHERASRELKARRLGLIRSAVEKRGG